MERQIYVIDAPSNLGLKPPAENREPGTHKAPAAIRAHGLLNRINASDGGIVPTPAYSFELPGKDGIRNAENIVRNSSELAQVVGGVIDRDDFPLVLGGDCSILLGSMLALRERGRYGLFFVDGHKDMLTPSTSVTGGAAGMDLALALGVGPELISDLKGLRPLVGEEDVVVFGYRDPEYPRAKLEKSLLFGLAEIRQKGFEEATRQALAWLQGDELDGFWLHLDVDVLDSSIMPAVDSPQPDGFSYEGLTTVVRTVLSNELCVGMQVTIFDPDLDPDGRYAKYLTTMLVDAFLGEQGGDVPEV